MQTILLSSYSNGLGYSNLKAFGAFVIVMVLLLICLKILQKLNASKKSAAGTVIYSASAGPNRSIEHIQTADKVHVIYKNDGAMVVLESVAIADYKKPDVSSTGKSSIKKLFARS
ncbi:hypothetical protein HOD41_00255 [bacterium]|jgi:flagellar biogenesis protein FliO|nr:hypothetical protein [bacterium]MBT7310751.1 hypothetical protein [bacterium]